MREVPFHRPAIGEEEIQAVVDVLRSGWLTTGPRVQEFERQFARYVGARHAIAVNSGTAALHLSLLAAGVRPGDAVLTSTFTFPATAEAAIYCGARPILADVDPRTLNLDPDAVEAILTGPAGEHVRAIVPVHYAGQPAAMERIVPLAERHGIPIIEDAAHALPAWRQMPGRRGPASVPAGTELPAPSPGFQWTMVGTIGQFTAFSFYATKPLTTGEGGMITCDDDAAVGLLRSLRLHGLSGDAWNRHRSTSAPWFYDVQRTGYKYNLPDLLAAIGIEQLKRSDRLATERRWLAQLYRDALEPLADCVDVSHPEDAAIHAWHLFPVRLRNAPARDRVLRGLRARRIGASVHFIPLHLHTFYAETYGFRRGDFPVAEAAFDSILSLPLYPGLEEADVGAVVDALQAEVTRPARAGATG